MKKLFPLISCIICAVMLATTGFAAGNSDAYSLYKNATASMETAKSVEMSGYSKTTMAKDNGASETTNQTFTAKTLKTSDGKTQMEMLTKDVDTNETIALYYKDGFMYTNTGNDKFRIDLDVEQAVSQFDVDLPQEAFENAVVEQTAAGTVIKLKVNPNEIQDVGGISLAESIAESDPDSNIKVGNFYYTILIGSDNKLKSYSVSFSMTMTIEGETIRTKSAQGYNIVSVNKVNWINFPADLNTYKTL